MCSLYVAVVVAILCTFCGKVSAAENLREQVARIAAYAERHGGGFTTEENYIVQLEHHVLNIRVPALIHVNGQRRNCSVVYSVNVNNQGRLDIVPDCDPKLSKDIARKFSNDSSQLFPRVIERLLKMISRMEGI